MKKRTLKVLSLILAIVMAISIMPLAALAGSDSTKKTRYVGVVVYGSEFTALLNSGENLSLEEFLATVTDISTKITAGEGISVPEVDMSVINNETGEITPLEERDDINIVTQTLEMTIPFEDIITELQGNLKSDIEKLKEDLNQSTITSYAVSTVESVLGNMTAATTDAVSLMNKITGEIAALTKLNPTLYRTYVTEKEVPEGDYTVRIENFYDTDADNNAITRDGYVILSNGLTDVGYGSTKAKEFYTQIHGLADEEKNEFNAIEFVGPSTKGISGEIPGVDLLKPLYETTVNSFTTLATTMTGVRDAIENFVNKLDEAAGRIPGADLVGTLRDKVLSEIPGYEFLMEWEVPPLEAELKSTYEFKFPGLWCQEVHGGFTFTNVDVAGTPIANASTFLLINRDETIDVLKLMLDLGKETFSAVLKATFGYTDEETGKEYESMLNLYTQLINYKEGQFSIDSDIAYDIVQNYIAIISDVDLLDKVIDTESDNALVRLKYPIPAVLMATADENGRVTFNKDCNMTLTWMLEIIPKVTAALAELITSDEDAATDDATTADDAETKEENQILKLLKSLSDYAIEVGVNVVEDSSDMMAGVINTLVYPFAQRLGLVGQKFGSGHYIMFQIKTDDAYWVNPMAYTMIMTWENDVWLYVTVADLGLILPYLTEDFYDFVRGTTFEGVVDGFLSTLTGKEVDLVDRILNGEGDRELDVTKEVGQKMDDVLTGAFTAFVGVVGFDSLNLDSIFANRSEFIAGINQFLYDNGRTAQNLMMYVNQQAKKAKSVYAGYVTSDWYFYNLDKSPTATATKLIDKSTQDISAEFVNETASGIVSGIGTGISKVVNTVGTAIESAFTSVATAVKSSIGTAVSSAASKVVSSVKTGLTSLVKNIFKR